MEKSCSETKPKVGGYTAEGHPIVGGAECTTTKTVGELYVADGKEIDYFKLDTYTTAKETTKTFPCGQDPEVVKPSGTLTTTDQVKFVTNKEVEAKTPEIIKDYESIVDNSMWNAIDESSKNVDKDMWTKRQKTYSIQGKWWAALAKKDEIDYRSSNFKTREDLFSTCWLRIGSIHFGCTDDREEVPEEQANDFEGDWKYTEATVDSKIREELDAEWTKKEAEYA